MQQSLPHRGTKKRLAKIRLQKIVSLQPPSDHGLQWKQLVLWRQPSSHRLLQQQPISSPSPGSPPPTLKPLHWITTHTFSGNGSQKTATFNVGTHWRMVWSCKLVSGNGLDNLVMIEVDAPEGSIVDSGMETMRQQNKTHGVNEIHAGGQVYLKVISGGNWRVQVQEWE